MCRSVPCNTAVAPGYLDAVPLLRGPRARPSRPSQPSQPSVAAVKLHCLSSLLFVEVGVAEGGAPGAGTGAAKPAAKRSAPSQRVFFASAEQVFPLLCASEALVEMHFYEGRPWRDMACRVAATCGSQVNRSSRKEKLERHFTSCSPVPSMFTRKALQACCKCWTCLLNHA